jgi:hypothetical protein
LNNTAHDVCLWKGGGWGVGVGVESGLLVAGKITLFLSLKKKKALLVRKELKVYFKTERVYYLKRKAKHHVTLFTN